MRAIVCTLLLAACTAPEVEELRRALPDERVTLDDAALRGSAAARGVGEPSDYYQYTVDGIDDVNTGIGDVLLGLQEITSFPATYTRNDHTAMWGPWLDDGTWGKLWVRGEPDGSYAWAFSIRPEDSAEGDWSEVVTGQVDAGATEEASAGRFAIDFTTVDALGAGDGETGQLAVVYELRPGGAEVTLGVGEFSDGGEPPADGAVHYAYDADGGAMDWRARADVSDPADGTVEDAAILARWDATGAGRADAEVTGGELGPLTWTEIDCWDASHRTVFFESNAELRREGDASRCAF